jgi:hypothetical protein
LVLPDPLIKIRKTVILKQALLDAMLHRFLKALR